MGLNINDMLCYYFPQMTPALLVERYVQALIELRKDVSLISRSCTFLTTFMSIPLLITQTTLHSRRFSMRHRRRNCKTTAGCFREPFARHEIRAACSLC
jgi:hypothetical protein